MSTSPPDHTYSSKSSQTKGYWVTYPLHPADDDRQTHPTDGASSVGTCKCHLHTVVLALLVNVVGHNVHEMNGLALGHVVHVEKIEATKHPSTIFVARGSPAK